MQVFYYPQDTPIELGPTEVVPGSHHLFSLPNWMRHYGSICGAVRTAAPAGSIFVTAYPIWHRRSVSTVRGVRNMMKYCYWRTEAPRNDWIVEPDFDFAMAPFSFDGLAGPLGRQQFRDWYDTAQMFCWLCGDPGRMEQVVGGEGWPMGYPPPQIYRGEQIYAPKGFRRFPARGSPGGTGN